MKLLSITIPLLLLVLTSSYLESAMAVHGHKAFCDHKCGMRCSKAEKESRCMKDCKTCCAECKCVPSGTYGNKDECPCYRDKVTSDPHKRPMSSSHCDAWMACLGFIS